MKTRISWKHVSSAVVAGAIVATLPVADSYAQGTPRKGGTLTVAVEADLRQPDAHQARISVDKMVMGSTVYDALFQTDEKGNSLSSLAASAKASADAKEWTFRLREGVKFHNGKSFTAEVVKKNIEAYLDPKMASNLRGDLGNVDSVSVVGPYEVKFSLKRPDGQLPSIFTDNIFMFDTDSFEPGKPIGTGPYAWDQRVTGDRIVFKRFDNHWRGVPPLDRVVFRVIPDAQVAALELRSGGVDVVPSYVSVAALPALRADPNIRVYETSGTTIYQAFLNFEKERRGGYKDGAAFRQGIAHFWNAQKLVPAIIGEFGELATQVIPPSQAGHDASIGSWPFDPEKGRPLLAKAGIDRGGEIYLLVWKRPYNCDHATALASLLTEQGYKPKLVCLEPEAAVAAVRKYDWDLLFARTSGRPTAYQTLYDRWRMSLAPNPPDDFYTLRDEGLEQTIAAMGAATNPADYERLGKRAAQTIMKEKIGILPAYWDKVRVVARSRVHGIKVSPTVYYGFLMNQMTTVWVD